MLTMSPASDGHDQKVTHSYTAHYPEHAPREKDPHYHLFEEVKRRYKATAKCWYGEEIGDHSRCDGGLELHHWVIEQAVINEVDPRLLDASYPDAPHDPDQIDAWVQSHYGETLIFLCEKHHRGHAGVHVVDYANWKASLFAPNLLP